MFGTVAGWAFGILILILGILNLLYGNDADFGAFLVLISFVFYPPVNQFVQNRFHFSIPVWMKVVGIIGLVVTILAAIKTTSGILSKFGVELF